MPDMRNLQELREDLLKANVEAVAAQSGVATKTIYRIRWSPEYRPSIQTVEQINSALDRLKGKAAKTVKVRARAPEERAESATADAQG